MTDSFVSDVEALMAQLAAEPAKPVTAQRSRLIVATSWERAAVPLTILRAFSAIVPSSASVELVFAVPHEPSQLDVECIGILAEGAGLETLPEGLQLMSFDEVQTLGYDTAVVCNGDVDQLLAQVGGMITRMHALVRGDGEGSGRNPGDPGALRRRLAEFLD